MSIRALNQNFPSSDFAAKTDEQGPYHHLSPPHCEGGHPYPNPWSFQSGSGQVDRPRHPHPSACTQVDDKGQAKEFNNESGDGATFRRPYLYPGLAEGHPSHTYHGPAEGIKPYPFPWDDGKTKPCPRKPYPYPGPADDHKPHPYSGAVPWRQPYPSPWEEDDKDKSSFPRQSYQFPDRSQSPGRFSHQPHKYPGNPQGVTSFHQQPYPVSNDQHGEHRKGGWDWHGSFGQPHFGGPSFSGFGRGGLDGPHAPPYGPWAFGQQVPYEFPSTGSHEYEPEIDVFDTPETFVIHLPLPGAKEEDIELNWDPKTVEISITGVISRPDSEDLVKTIALDEREVGAFERKVRLGSRANPPKVDGDSISAKLADGVLVIEVPKRESDDVEVKRVEVE